MPPAKTPTKTEPAPKVEAQEDSEAPETEAITIGDWQFREVAPTTDDVLALLKTLPAVRGIEAVNYADYVQALPSSMKTGGKRGVPAQHVDTWTLYMAVAGRVRMVNDAAEKHGWRVDFEPEPVTPTGIPGYLRADDERIVYREYCTIYALVPARIDEHATTPQYVPVEVCLGRRPGTAWVPNTGGQQAVASNRYEKVETSARGRAIAAWGFGVLPGSGIASLEEMQSANENRQSEARGADTRGRGNAPRKSRPELIEAIMTNAEQLRQARGEPEGSALTKVAQFAKARLGVGEFATEGYNEGDTEVVTAVDWSRLKDGQLQLILNAQAKSFEEIAAAKGEV